ncbi:MAG: hypothetical protein NT011_07080 [Kiritimatiellaeota bacterium]|nr:hypothetical protein [Kiritimatiellota bacterium]
MMSPRERLLSPFRGVKPDRPAWLADLSYWYEAMLEAGKLPLEFKGRDGYKRLHEYYGVCCHYGCLWQVCTTRYDQVEIRTDETQCERIHRWLTPGGELTARWKYMAQSSCWACVEYPVKSAADLKIVQDIFARTHYDPVSPGEYLSAAARLGESGLPITPLPRSPLPALFTDWCGVMNTIYLITDEPRAVEDTLSIIDRSNDGAFNCIVSGPAELLHFGDNLDSGNCASYFNEYMGAYYQRRLDQIHKAGKFAVVHLDGMVRGLLPKLAACGFDGIESITPAPVGDVAIEELRAVAADPKTIIWGGIPGAMFAKPWTMEDIRAHTRRLLETLWPAGRLIVGSADQIPPDGDIEFCRVIADTIEDYNV